MKKNRNTTLGNLKEIDAGNTAIIAKAENGNLCLRWMNDSILNVQVVKPNCEFEDFSFAVVGQQQVCEIATTENDELLNLKSSKLKVEVQKEPTRIAFKTLAGETINVDDASFGISWLGDEVTCYKQIHKNERFIGLGEKTGNLDRRGNAYVNWNTDYFAYPANGDPLYCSIPFYIGIKEELFYGIFLDSSYKTVFNFGASNDRFVYFSADDGPMNYYFIYGNSVSEVITQYTWLTGNMPLPPLWSLGFQQCRYSYYPDKEVLTLAQTFREKQIPCDVIYLDIHYMDAYKAFTFDKNRFPKPAEMVAKLRELGFHVTVILDPGIKVEKGYAPYDSGIENGVFVQYPDGVNFTAEVWPGECHFPDFTSANVREWWAGLVEFYTDFGIEGFWNDMNEPAAWGQHIPDLIEFDFEGNTATHKQARNVYGMNMARATRQGAEMELDGKRPFLLTRAGFAGIQRHAAVWTGDNVASDEHMLAGIRLVTSLGLSGVPFAGYDVGGFAGEASPALFARWISIAAFSPFFRCHSMVNSRDAEPWAFGEEVEEIARNYINLRYRLLPYIYSCMHESSQSGMPLQRSLAFDFPFDENVFDPNFQNQYMFGSSLLVCPVESTKSITKVYLPKGEWCDFHNDKKHAGNQIIYVDCPKERLPVFVKAGAIVSVQPVVQNTSENAGETLELHVWAGADGELEYYEDDGVTDPQLQDGCCKRLIQYDSKKEVLSLKELGERETSKFKMIKILLHGSKLPPEKVEPYTWLDPISKFDPQGGVAPRVSCDVFVIEGEFSEGEIKIGLDK